MACVSHRHGANAYVSFNESILIKELAAYAHGNWPGDEPYRHDVSPETLIDQFFSLCARQQGEPDCLEFRDSIAVDDPILTALEQLIRRCEQHDAAMEAARKQPDGADYRRLMDSIRTMRKTLTAAA